jgi:hypothetical protein
MHAHGQRCLLHISTSWSTGCGSDDRQGSQEGSQKGSKEGGSGNSSNSQHHARFQHGCYKH